MNILISTFLICFTININKISNKIQDIYPTIYNDTIANIHTQIKNIITNFSKLTNKNISDACLGNINTSYTGDYYYSYITKLFFDSAPSFEDIKNYYNCYNNLYINAEKDILDNITFIVIKYKDEDYNNKTEAENFFNSFNKVFGACVLTGCENDEYYEIIKFINENNYLIEGTIEGAINLKPSKKYSIGEKIIQIIIPLLSNINYILEKEKYF